MKVYRESERTIWTTYSTDADGKNPIIPVTSNSLIISPTIDFILPGKLPLIGVGDKSKGKDAIYLDKKQKVDCFIYNKKFNESDAKDVTEYTIYDVEGKPIKINSLIGNLLNVYFRYETFVSVYNQVYTSADVINSLLDTINSNMYGLCKLELQKSSDGPDGSPLIVIDRKLNIPIPKVPELEIFRFKVGALNSIVKEFSFNMELSTLMQAQALYASQLAISSTTSKTPPGSSAPEKDPYAHADLSYAKNSDGYYSVNAVEIEIVRDGEEWNKYIEDVANVKKEDPKPKDGEEEIENPLEVRNRNYVRFKENPNSKTEKPKAYIYTDAGLIQKEIAKASEKKGTTALTYLDITLAIDGMAGISCGEYFHIDGVPEIYNKNGYFQVTNVKQGIDANGWKTTIEAGYRINAKEE
jgi:hypothetical protein